MRSRDALVESKVAKVALAGFQSLYRVERKAREEGLRGESLVEYRRQHALPTLEKLESYLQERRSVVPPKTQTGEAIQYALNHWSTLERYVDLAKAQSDNNSAENSIRPIARGRRNWLFIGHRDAGPRAETMLSLVASCWRLKIAPPAYLRDVTEKMIEGPKQAAELTSRLCLRSATSDREDRDLKRPVTGPSTPSSS